MRKYNQVKFKNEIVTGISDVLKPLEPEDTKCLSSNGSSNDNRESKNFLEILAKKVI